MAPRHATAATGFDARRAVAFSDVGGSGLIVVVIVVAWALFLVPQWMHRRASAAAHLADRIPERAGSEGSEFDHGDADDASLDASGRTARRFGRRSLARTRSRYEREASGARFSRWHLPSMPSIRRRPSREPVATSAAPRSAAARRRRLLTYLALATLLTAVGVGVAALLGLTAPTWVVAIPGGAMLGYLALLAIVRPGAPARAGRRPVASDEHAGVAASARRVPDALVGAALGPALPAAPLAHELPAYEPSDVLAERSVEVGGDVASVETATAASEQTDTWTPVPLPTPTYVTAPRARRSVRTIDLSNPGSWTSSAAPAAPGAPVAAASSEADEHDDYLVEHRRAVGD